jgi:hypothetical protein
MQRAVDNRSAENKIKHTRQWKHRTRKGEKGTSTEDTREVERPEEAERPRGERREEESKDVSKQSGKDVRKQSGNENKRTRGSRAATKTKT